MVLVGADSAVHLMDHKNNVKGVKKWLNLKQ